MRPWDRDKKKCITLCRCLLARARGKTIRAAPMPLLGGAGEMGVGVLGAARDEKTSATAWVGCRLLGAALWPAIPCAGRLSTRRGWRKTTGWDRWTVMILTQSFEVARILDYGCANGQILVDESEIGRSSSKFSSIKVLFNHYIISSPLA